MPPKKPLRKSETRIAESYARKTVSNLPPSDVLAICCSDIHLSHKPPLARSAEPDWYKAMARQLHELSEVWHKLKHPVIIYAGDIFDKWNAPPELINFALNHLPQGYAIPGQHDLPLHSSLDIEKSAYWTLEIARCIQCLKDRHGRSSGIKLHGFAWQAELKPLEKEFEEQSKTLQVAIVHKYCWSAGHNPANEEKGICSKIMKELNGFDAIVAGDNHDGFIINGQNQSLINCGTFFRRRIDERNYQPMVGLLLASGKIVPYYMDVSQDKFINAADEPMELLLHGSFAEFVDKLESLESDGLDFTDALTRAMKKTLSPEGRKLILEALEEVKQ